MHLAQILSKHHCKIFPGTIPATFVTETMMNHVAKVLNKTPDEIREINFYKKDQVMSPEMIKMWNGWLALPKFSGGGKTPIIGHGTS